MREADDNSTILPTAVPKVAGTGCASFGDLQREERAEIKRRVYAAVDAWAEGETEPPHASPDTSPGKFVGIMNEVRLAWGGQQSMAVPAEPSAPAATPKPVRRSSVVMTRTRRMSETALIRQARRAAALQRNLKSTIRTAQNDKAVDDAVDVIDDTLRKLANSPATTIEGIRAKARALIECEPHHVSQGAVSYGGEMLVASILLDLRRCRPGRSPPCAVGLRWWRSPTAPPT